MKTISELIKENKLFTGKVYDKLKPVATQCTKCALPIALSDGLLITLPFTFIV